MLTLCTISYNNANATLDFLASLERQTSRDFDVIVVDNASHREERERLATYAITSTFALDLIFSDRNRGFSGGNNLAIRKALGQGSEWILLINNDTTVAPDFIASLYSHVDLEHATGMIAIPLREGEGRIAFAGEVHWFRPTLPHAYSLSSTTFRLSSLFYVIGAGMFVHRSVFEKIGFLDERYFLYFEDADFSMRARAAGISVSFIDYPTINHAVSQSTKLLSRPLLLRYHARNSLLFNWDNGPWWVRAVLPVASVLRILLQFVKILFVPSQHPASRAIAAGIFDFYAQRFGKIDSHRD